MFVVHRHGHVDLDVEVDAPDATVGEVADALRAREVPHRASSAPFACTLRVDGAVVEPRRPFALAGVASGAVLEVVRACPLLAPPSTPPEQADPGWILSTSNGLWSGRRHLLRNGRTTFGRAPGAPGEPAVPDPTVSASHLRLDVDAAGVRVEDLDSRNGTWLCGEPLTTPARVDHHVDLTTGSTRLTVRREARLSLGARPRAGPESGPRPFHRPPRRQPPPGPRPLTLPSGPPAPASALPVGITAIVLPLVLGVCLMWLLHSVLWGLFSLLGPLVVLGGSWEQRRRGRRGARRATARFRRELAVLRAALDAAATGARKELDATAPDLATLAGWATAGSGRLWESRPVHADWLLLRLGLGLIPWEPPLDLHPDALAGPVAEVLDDHRCIPDAPVLVGLAGGTVLGLAGDDESTRAVARSLLLQAAVRHGPADLRLAVLSDAAHAPAWHWAQRLPHTRSESVEAALVAAGDAADTTAAALLRLPRPRDTATAASPLLVVVDAPRLLRARRSAVRALLAEPHVSAVVVGGGPGRLPAACATTMEVDAAGRARLAPAERAGESVPLQAMGTDEATAAEIARQLAAWEDPETAGASRLPAAVSLTALIDGGVSVRSAVESLPAGGDGLTVPLGVTADGPFLIDLVADGPHALVAGTTGSGKSELLRSLVLGLAATHAPEEVELALVDFKGGSSFSRCAALPHVVGTVTDLDGGLARRAVLALEGELRRRELLLQRAGVADLDAYGALRDPPSPLPRLVVVIDEFATLAADHPGVLDGFVAVAQRGRSLGLHLVLATQRPSGSVSDHIRANTNLRIALRVQDPADSVDVVDVPDAAALPRRRPGRALVRLGPGELVEMQTAAVLGAAAAGQRAGIQIHPLAAAFDREPTPCSAGDAVDELITAICQAHLRRGHPAPRPLWPDPLPDRISLEELWRPLPGANRSATPAATAPLSGSPALPPFALGDDPSGQRRVPVRWTPGDGHLLVVGTPGSGTTGALVAACLALTHADGPGTLHVYAIDLGGALGPLANLPHTGAMVGGSDVERQCRLLRFLGSELARRRNAGRSGSTEPQILLVIDGIGALLATHDDPFDLARPTLERLLADGPGAGVHLACSAERPGAVPPAWMSLIRHRLVLALAEPADLAPVGVPHDVVLPAVPGRGWWSAAGLLVQVGDPGGGLRALAERRAPPPSSATPAPRRIGALPARVRPHELAEAWSGSLVRADGVLRLPVGIAEDDLGPAVLELHPAEHALVLGPPRSGCSSLLVALAHVAARSDPDLTVAVLGAGRATDPLWPAAVHVLDRARWCAQLQQLAATGAPVLALVDEGHRLADEESVRTLLRAEAPNLHLVVSARSGAVRAAFGHWTRRLAESRSGLLLAPDVDLDGELFGVRLPRRAPAAPGTGRGWLVADGAVTYLQAAG